MPSSALQLTELAAGHHLDRYELMCPVAQGGMASVWLARLRGKHGFEKLVALKTILPSLAEDKLFRRMLLDEARLASRIEHVNVAQMLDLGEQDGHLYLVMEWVDGDSLSTLDRTLERAGQWLPLPILLRVMVEACAGLHAAHELCDPSGAPLGVVHRDVSPQNILVSVKGQTKLIDFGIAKAQSGPSEETRAGFLKGKVNYMPPEQAMRKTVDRRTDVWAVGAVLYRMLSRRTPYESPSPVTSLRLLTSLQPPAPLPEHVEPGLNALVMRALSPKPEHRPATARELQNALEEVAPQVGGLCSSEELASFVSSHLGQTLQERRDRITVALSSATERDTVAERHKAATDSNSGVKDTAVDRSRPAVSDPDTGALNPSVSSTAVTLQMPSRAPEVPSRSRWTTALGVVALVGLALWGLSSLRSGQLPAESATPKTAAAPAASPLEPAASEPAPQAASPEPEPLSVSDLASESAEPLPPPVLPSALPLSQPEPARPASKASAPVAPKPSRKAPSTTPSKRKRVDDGF